MVKMAPYPTWHSWVLWLKPLTVDEIKTLLEGGIAEGLLTKHYEYPLDCEYSFEVEPEEIEMAEKDGYLVHPDSGDEIYDWKSSIIELYRPTKRTRQIWEEANQLKLAALNLYTPPFKYCHGYIYDNKNEVVADQDGVESSIALQIRGWGHIQYHQEVAPSELQDFIGQMTAEALTKYWELRADVWGEK